MKQLVPLLAFLLACDGVSSEPMEPDAPGPVIVQGNKRVFVTDQTFVGGMLGGLAGADMKCEARAAAAGLAGTYKAWLSDTTVSASARLTHSTGAYLLVDGTMIAANFDELTSGTLRHAIDLDQFGAAYTAPSKCAVVGGLVAVWTATDADGTALDGDPINCQDWRRIGPDGLIDNGLVGNAQATSLKWTFGNCALSCTDNAALYCIEQ